MPNEPKTKSVLQMTNDPSRPCWSFLADVLGRNLTPPAGTRESWIELRELLIEAYTKNPYKLFRMAILGMGKGNLSASFQAFSQSISNDTFEMQTTHGDPTGVSGQNTAAARTAMDYILTNWWNMSADGSVTVARSKVYADLGTSTNEPIKAWLPDSAGVISYLRARTQHIFYAYYKKQRLKERTVSLDRCMEFNYELAQDGRFVRDLAATPDLGEVHSADIGETDAEIEAAPISAADLAQIVSAPEEGLASFEYTVPREFKAATALERQIEGLRGEKVNRPLTYGIWPLLAFDPEFTSLAADKRTSDEVRNGVRRILRRLSEVDDDIKADLTTLFDVLAEWDGEQPLVELLPELEIAAMKHREFLATAPGSEVAKRVDDLIAPLWAEIDMDSTPKKEKDAMSLAAELADVDSVALADHRLENIDLNSPLRPDYVFLALKQGQTPSKRLRGPSLHAEMKTLVIRLLNNISANAAFRHHHMALRRWDPATSLIGEELAENVRKLQVEMHTAPALAAPDPTSQSEMAFT